MRYNLHGLLVILLFYSHFAYPRKDVPEKFKELEHLIDSCHQLNQSYDYETRSSSDKYIYWEEGAVFLLNGEKHTGMIQIPRARPDERIPIKIELVKPELKERKRYRADKVSYFLKGEKRYDSIRISGKGSCYTEVLDSGAIKLYIYKCLDSSGGGTYIRRTHYYLGSGGKDAKELFPNRLHLDYLHYFDQNELIKEYVEGKYYNHEKVRALLQVYNQSL